MDLNLVLSLVTVALQGATVTLLLLVMRYREAEDTDLTTDEMVKDMLTKKSSSSEMVELSMCFVNLGSLAVGDVVMPFVPSKVYRTLIGTGRPPDGYCKAWTVYQVDKPKPGVGIMHYFYDEQDGAKDGVHLQIASHEMLDYFGRSKIKPNDPYITRFI